MNAESKKSFLGIKKKNPENTKKTEVSGVKGEKNTHRHFHRHSGDETVRVDVITAERNGISSTLN